MVVRLTDIGFDDRDTNNYTLRPTVRVVIYNQRGDICLYPSKRRHRLYPPGGGVEEGETIAEAAQRESLEEVGCKITDITEMAMSRSTHHKDNHIYEVTIVTARLVSQGPATSKEADEQGLEGLWLPISEYMPILRSYHAETPDDAQANRVLEFFERCILKQ